MCVKCCQVSKPDSSLSFPVAQAKQGAQSLTRVILSLKRRKKHLRAWRKVRYPQDWGLREAGS